MKTKLLGISLFAATLTAVLVYPALRSNALPGTHLVPPDPAGPIGIDPIALPGTNQTPKVEVVFVLDTTGSMGGLIEAAKEKIWSIASTMAQADPAPEISIGLVAYRDRGDQYVTRVTDLSDDLDSVYATLMDFVADGGGDGPESVNQALYDAVHQVSWSDDQDAYQVIFLVGDAPPHMDYPDDVKYPETLAAAWQRGIRVNTIQCGTMPMTTQPWQQIAALGHGRFFQVEQAGSAVAIATPFDEAMAELSAKLDDTRMFFGTETEKAAMELKKKATEKLHGAASLASRARRAAFNLSESGSRNLLGDNELVEAVASGRVDLDELDEGVLPEAMQAMAPEERKEAVAAAVEARRDLSAQLRELKQQRDDYLSEKVEEAGGAKESLDQKIYDAVRSQAAGVGLEYTDGPEY